MKFIVNILTGPDGRTYDLQLVLTFAGVMIFFGNSIAALWVKHQAWDPVAYATGLGLVLAAGAFGGLMNKWTHK